jgi:hypothetical protein
MMEWVAVLVPVLVALIGGPIMFTMHRFDKRNSEQHGRSMDVLKGIAADVVEVKGDVAELKNDVADLKADQRHLSADQRHLSERFRWHLDKGEAS